MAAVAAAFCLPLLGAAAAADREAAAEAALAAGDPARAVLLLRQVNAAEPGNLRAWESRITAQRAAGDPHGAATALAEISRGLLAAGRWDLAAGLLERHAAGLPERADLASLLGQALLLAQQAAAAAGHLELARELGDASPATALRLAAAWWEVGRLEAAEGLYRELLAGPAAATAREQLGGLLLWQGRAAEAVELLAPAGDAPEVLFDLGRALQEVGRGDEAQRVLRRVLAQDPEHLGARYALALALARAGRHEEAEGEMSRFAAASAAGREAGREAGLARARLDHGWALLAGGEAVAAAAHFLALPASAESWAGVAAARSAGGDHAGAAQALERALAIEPDRPDLRLRLAEERRAAGQRR